MFHVKQYPSPVVRGFPTIWIPSSDICRVSLSTSSLDPTEKERWVKPRCRTRRSKLAAPRKCRQTSLSPLPRFACLRLLRWKDIKECNRYILGLDNENTQVYFRCNRPADVSRETRTRSPSKNVLAYFYLVTAGCRPMTKS